MGKMFLVSSSTTISTFSTTTYCYVTAAAADCGKKRRKRAMNYIEGEEGEVSPTKINDVQPVEIDPSLSTARDPRFVMYWMTTTSTSSSTTFTATTTLGTLECTPSGFTLSVCG